MNTDNIFPIDIFVRTRHWIAHTVDALSAEQLLAVPRGFDNNILWNLGHIIVVHQGNIYSRIGLAPLVDLEKMYPLFRAGSSPSAWETPPDSAAIVAMLVGHADRVSADFSAGKFDDISYQSRTTGNGVEITTLTQAMLYNTAHETLHLGTIQALKNFVDA